MQKVLFLFLRFCPKLAGKQGIDYVERTGGEFGL